MKILVVDDEKLLVKGIKFNLENEGYTVEACYDGLTAVQMAAQGGYDLIILDLMMPGLDGLEACQRIRESSTVPIIMLTARSEDADKLLGFESGADDYITKPFNILELKARIRALLRRAGITASQPGSQSAHILEHGGVTLDTEKRSARKHGAAVDLTAREFDLAELFWRSPGRVFSRDSLLDLVWGFDYQGDARTVDVHIRRLREKLEDDPAAPRLIITKWGVGYYLAE
ncbi:MAG TPA: response regulator transcription factor [Candidatus Scatomorpha stercoravium]|nr:response regulator transcription factor [Candidatus Scatomorpha stercoravium]